jgi:hypothetical protein
MSSSWPRWDAGDDLIGPGSPADQLWELLRSLDEGEDTGRQGAPPASCWPENART